jgi:hypothetical protein
MTSDLSIPDIDLSHLQYSDLLEYDIEKHETVTEIDREIEVLEEELSDSETADRAYLRAKSELKGVRARRKLGNATEEDVKEAEAAVEEAQSAQSETEHTEIALSELRDHREQVVDAVREAFLDRCQELWSELVSKAEGPVRELLEIRARAKAVEEAYDTHNQGSMIGGPSFIRSVEYGEELPPYPVTTEDPGPLSMVSELQRWLREWT